MTASVEQLLSCFDALSDVEKYQATAELLRRVQEEMPGELSEQALIDAADELFRDLDAREAADGQGETR